MTSTNKNDMTVLSKSLKTETENSNNYDQLMEENHSDRISIQMKSTHKQISAMPEALKMQVRSNAPSLQELFDQTLAKKDEKLSKREWIGDDTLEVDGISQLTLHSFVLEAEKLGKSVKYTKTVTVEIAD